MRRLLSITAFALAACTPSQADDTFTVPDPPDGLALVTIEEFELSDQSLESTAEVTFTAEQVRLYQATTGGSMTLGGGIRQVFGSDQGSAAAWNDINNLNGDAGLVLTTFPATGEAGIELVSTIRSPEGVSATQITDTSGGLIEAVASNSASASSQFLVWQRSDSWIVLFSDTIPLAELTSFAETVEPARVSSLQDELDT